MTKPRICSEQSLRSENRLRGIFWSSGCKELSWKGDGIRIVQILDEECMTLSVKRNGYISETETRASASRCPL